MGPRIGPRGRHKSVMNNKSAINIERFNKTVKYVRIHTAYRATLISVYLPLSQTPGDTARPRIWG